MFPTYASVATFNDRIRPDRRHLPTESEIRLRVRRAGKAA